MSGASQEFAERIGAGAIEEVLELHITTNPSREIVSVGPPQGVNASVAILVAVSPFSLRHRSSSPDEQCLGMGQVSCATY